MLAAPLAQSTSTRNSLKSVSATKSASHSAYCSRSWPSPGSISAPDTTLWDAAAASLLDVGEDVRLDRVLQFVGELVAVGPEDLDAIVLPGIVRGGNHDAGREFIGAGEIGDARRSNNSGADHLDLGRLQRRRQGCADPGTRLARVLPD